MANQFAASIYSYNQGENSFGDQGRVTYFPSQGVIIGVLNPPQSFQSVYCASTIDIIIGAPPFPRYYAVETASDLATAANT